MANLCYFFLFSTNSYYARKLSDPLKAADRLLGLDSPVWLVDVPRCLLHCQGAPGELCAHCAFLSKAQARSVGIYRAK